MSSIIIGVDASERSEDAIAFGRRLAAVATADVIVANAYPYSADVPSRTSNAAYRDALREDALVTARTLRDQLEGIPEARTLIRIVADPSPAKALHHLADAERAALVILGSTHTGRAGRVLPGSTGERMLHGSPCAVAVVPQGYRKQADQPIRRIGVAFNETEEAKAALVAATELARAFGAELEIIAIVAPEAYSTPAVIGAPPIATLREEVERHVQESLDAVVAAVPEGVTVRGVRLTGGPADQLEERSAQLDLLITGSRGYGPLHSVIVGGVSGRVMRSAECPVIVVPRGSEAPLESVFAGTTATAA